MNPPELELPEVPPCALLCPTCGKARKRSDRVLQRIGESEKHVWPLWLHCSGGVHTLHTTDSKDKADAWVQSGCSCK